MSSISFYINPSAINEMRIKPVSTRRSVLRYTISS